MSTSPAYSLDTALLVDLLRDSLTEGKQPRLTVVSGSMSPLLEVGDQVLLGEASAEILSPGDIIVVAENHATLTHRYWRQYSEDGQTWLITRGDRVATWDPPHRANDLIGRVVARARDGETVTLDSGAGALANRRLANIAKIDNRVLARTQAASFGQSILRRVMRRALRAWAGFILRFSI